MKWLVFIHHERRKEVPLCWYAFIPHQKIDFLVATKVLLRLTAFLRALCAGGLAEEVNDAILKAAFIPFGELREVVLPIDPASSSYCRFVFYRHGRLTGSAFLSGCAVQNRGFAFIEFEDAEDAIHAIDNMNNAEFYGKVLRINYSRPSAVAKNRGRTPLAARTSFPLLMQSLALLQCGKMRSTYRKTWQSQRNQTTWLWMLPLHETLSLSLLENQSMQWKKRELVWVGCRGCDQPDRTPSSVFYIARVDEINRST